MTKNGNGWDTRPRVEFSGAISPVSGWLEVVAAIITLASAVIGILAVKLDVFASATLAVFVIAVGLTIATGFFVIHFIAARVKQHSLVHIGAWVLGVLIMPDEGRTLRWTRPQIRCPWCPPTKKRGVMTLEWISGEGMFVCRANAKQHRNLFDWTQI